MVLHDGKMASFGCEDKEAEPSSDVAATSPLEAHRVFALGERPPTHRHRRSSASVNASATTSSSTRRCGVGNSKPKRIVYLDHVHTHHHHHFHSQADWGVAGDVPPEELRLPREAKVELLIQRAHKQRDESQASVQASLSSGPAGPSSKQASSTPRKRPPLPAPVPVGIAPAQGLSPPLPLWDMSDSDSFVNANLNSISDGNGNGHHPLPQHSEEAPTRISPSCASTRKLPMPEYFSLISALPPSRALEFSPYSVSRSPRGFCRCLGAMP